MRILVTGGAGFIGASVVPQLLAEGDTVLNLDALTYAGNMGSLQRVANAPGYRFVRADIRDGAALERVFADFRPDAVLHLAAESHVDRSIDGPAAFIDTNVVGTCTLLEAARRHWQALPSEEAGGFRFHHVSTDEVFGSLAPEERFSEASAHRPNSPYSASKAAADHLVRAWHATYGLPVVTTHCSNNFGPYQFPEKLIPLSIISALGGRALPVYGSGQNVRDWLFVEDHARALSRVLRSGRTGEVYCIGADSERTNLQVVETICAILDESLPQSPHRPHRQLIRFVADRPGHDLRYATDSGRIREELGWRPRESFEGGLRKTVQWYLRNRDWWEPILSGAYRGERLGLGERGQETRAAAP